MRVADKIRRDSCTCAEITAQGYYDEITAHLCEPVTLPKA